MAAHAAKLEYARDLNYGEAAVGVGYGEPAVRQPVVTAPRERVAAADAAVKSAFGISLFAIVGAVFVGVLMVFVVLAQVSYNEVTNQTLKLQAKLAELSEQEKRLEIEHESVFDMNDVERYAKDVLGMAKPETDQVMSIQTVPRDKAAILESGDDEGAILGLGSFFVLAIGIF